MATASDNKLSICEHCSTSIECGAECISCEGFCCKSFHTKCVDVTSDELRRYRKKSNMWWICDQCILQIRQIRNDRLSGKQNMRVESVRPKDVDSVIDYGGEIAELKKQIAVIHETLSDTTITRSGADIHSIRSPGDNSPIAQSSPISTSKLHCGTRNVNGSKQTENLSSLDGKFWLFFTKIKNNVTECDISKMITDCLGTNESTVVKMLVPVWKDPSTMPYVSFKVGIETRFKGVALLPSTWPIGICFREFYNRVWEPQSG